MLPARPAHALRLGQSPFGWAPTEHCDRFVDVLLVCAVAGVVGQHWLTIATALDMSGPEAITSVSLLTPLLFFCNGAAAHDPRTLRRLVLPVMPLLAIWLLLPHLLPALGASDDTVDAASRLIEGPVRVVALLVLLTAATPVLLWLHRRWHGVEVLVMAGGAVAQTSILVWAIAFQIGIAYAAGSVRWARGARALAVAGIGLAVTVLAVAAGPYTSSINPPTAVLLAITMVQLGLALALRPVIERWATATAVARPLDWLCARWVTIYLWHLPALIAVAGVAVIGLGWSAPDLLSATWLRDMPAWTAAVAFTLLGLIRLFERLERPPTTYRPVRRHIARERVGA